MARYIWHIAAAATSPERVFDKGDSSRARLERMVWSGWGFASLGRFLLAKRKS